ncbi:flagellar hook-basal body complex protein FliE [Christensenellaceae bacterium OttesenSCG-928-K19]|nr:flagellar hook-basal body complex protein FliE [Christensenellaceae bacterium OttesenSCG-928-K19]
MRLTGVESAIGQGLGSITKQKEAADGSNFSNMLTGAIQDADQLYQVTEADTQALLSGEVDNLAQVMINSTKSEMALNLVVQVRNKIIDAYNEFMRMQV